MKNNDIQNPKLPDWYWTRGLHDAVVLSVISRENCLEICLDSTNAMLERDIKKISLFNYKIQTPEVKLSELTNVWWLRDNIQTLPNHRYLLEIIFENGKRKRKSFTVLFKNASIERG